MRISIITVCYNAADTIESTILSVVNQDYDKIEYIIIDGGSKDNTADIVSKYRKNIDLFISEKDNGIYDAINKGIQAASGEIIGLLNADDEFFNNSVVSDIAKTFIHQPELESVIGDIVFVNKFDKIIRKYSSNNWAIHKFEWGFMPAHPSFYCRKSVYGNLGLYDTEFKIAADYELLIRFLKVNKITFQYLPMIFVKMKLGGVSTSGFSSLITINKEIYLACKRHGINTNYLKLLLKYFIKIFEFTTFR